MKYLKLLTLVCMFGALSVACGDDDPNDGDVNCNSSFSLNAEIQDEVNAANAATSAYTNNPTTENCEAFVAAWQAYLDAAASFEECAQQAGQGAEFQTAIEGAMQSIASIQC